MKARLILVLLGVSLVLAAWASVPVRAATFPIDYSDPSSDVVRLNSTTNLCVVDANGACVMSPDPHDVNIQWVRGRDLGTRFNLTIQVQGRIRDYPNTTYAVNLYADATNRTHWSVNYTDRVLLLYMNATGSRRVDISGNATIWGPNPTNLDSLSMFVNKTLLGGPSNLSASVNIDGTAIMRGNPSLGQWTSFEDYGWEVPGHPATSPTVLNGHVYVRGTTTPIAGATVALSGGQTVLTNDSGFYSFGLGPGAYNASVSKAGYVTATFSVTLTAGQTVTRDVELERTLGAALGDWLLPIIVLVVVLAVVVAFVLVLRRQFAR